MVVEEKVNEEILILDQLKSNRSSIETERKSKSKKELKKKKKLPLRDKASREVYRYLMSLDRPLKYPRYVWARNRVSITLLRCIGGPG